MSSTLIGLHSQFHPLSTVLMCSIVHVHDHECFGFSLSAGLTTGSMNNLNDPPRWNIPPGAGGRGAGAGDGNQWNYALLVPMLGLAAFRKFKI